MLDALLVQSDFAIYESFCEALSSDWLTRFDKKTPHAGVIELKKKRQEDY